MNRGIALEFLALGPPRPVPVRPNQVNNPGSWSALYAPLAHAPWYGCTATDLVLRCATGTRCA